MQAKLRVARAALTFVGGVALGVAGPVLGFELCMAEPMLVADNGAPPVPSAPGAHAGAMIGRLFVMARPSFGRSGSSLSGGGARPLTQVNAVGAESSRAGAHGSLRASLVADGRLPVARRSSLVASCMSHAA